MLMLKKNALRVGVMAALFGTTFVACKNNDNDNPGPTPRSKNYDLVQGAGTAVDSAKKIGVLTLKENLQDTSVTVSIKLDKSTKDVKHILNLISGSVAVAKTDTLVKKFEIAGTGNALTAEITKKLLRPDQKKFSYDSAVNYASFAKVVYSATKDSIIAIGNVTK
jgi:hypothetical protein